MVVRGLCGCNCLYDCIINKLKIILQKTYYNYHKSHPKAYFLAACNKFLVCNFFFSYINIRNKYTPNKSGCGVCLTDTYIVARGGRGPLRFIATKILFKITYKEGNYQGLVPLPF